MEPLFADEKDELMALLFEDPESERARAARRSLSESVDRHRELKTLRKKHPWLADLICVLLPHKNGLHRLRVFEALKPRRKAYEADGLPMPKEFEKTVQGIYQDNCLGCENFERRSVSESKALFHLPRGKGTGYWGVIVREPKNGS